MSTAEIRSLTARRYDTGQPVHLALAAGHIAECTPLSHDPPTTESLPWIAPAFVDLQVNGYGGQEFADATLTAEAVDRIARQMLAFGATRFFPTLTTHSADVFRQSLRTIATACDANPALARRIAGIHLEGPYLSAEDGPRGAHPQAHCRPPNWDEFSRFQQAADGRIRLITLAPEYPQAPQFIRRAVAAGVTVALGHTAATGDQIRAAVDAGARLSTHLGNGAHRMLRRHPNYLWDQLAEDRLSASLIVDGQHLPPEVVQSFVRAKGYQRCILVSDLSGLAGLPPGRYESSGCQLEILPDGRLVIAGQDQLLAGASRPIGDGIANVIAFAGVSLEAAVDMATRRPAELVGLHDGSLGIGQPANLVLFDLLPAAPATSASPAPVAQKADSAHATPRAAAAHFQLHATLEAAHVVAGELPH